MGIKLHKHKRKGEWPSASLPTHQPCPSPAWRQLTQNGQSPGHPRAQDLRALLVLRLINAASPGVRNPEPPRTQLTSRLSGPLKTKKIIPFWGLAGTRPTLETGTGRARQTFPLTGKSQVQRNKEEYRGAPLPGPKPPNGPPHLQPPDLGLENNLPHSNWSSTEQLYSESKLAPRTLRSADSGRHTPRGHFQLEWDVCVGEVELSGRI